MFLWFCIGKGKNGPNEPVLVVQGAECRQHLGSPQTRFALVHAEPFALHHRLVDAGTHKRNTDSPTSMARLASIWL